MGDKLKDALFMALDKEFEHLPDPAQLDTSYRFSAAFEQKVRALTGISGYRYVSVGRHRVRRAVLIALILTMLLSMAVGAGAIRKPVAEWITKDNAKDGTMDVSFEVDDPNGIAETFAAVKPETPAGYEIVREEEEAFLYQIEYENPADGTVIYYFQHGNLAGMGLGIDNEDSGLREICINGYQGYILEKYDTVSLMWSDGKYLFDLSGTCSMEVLQEMAKTIY